MDVDKGRLKASIKSLNSCGLAKFQVDLKQPMETLVSDFMSAVETVSVEKENELPDSVADMYNILADNKTMEGGFDIADAALAARQKKEEIDMGKKNEVVEKKETKPAKEKPVKVTKPIKEIITKEKPVKEKKPKIEKVEKDQTKINVRPGSKFDMAIDFVRNHPGATCYDLKQQPWNDKNDPFRNLFTRLIERGQARKEGKGYFINEGF